MSTIAHIPPIGNRNNATGISINAPRYRRSRPDVYNALTDRDAFDKLLQQGLKEEYLPSKDQLIEFFMSIKDKVRIEDLIVHEPIWTLKREKGKCSICNEFANILCVNCKITYGYVLIIGENIEKDRHT